VIFSTDWGFAKEDDKDSYLARPEIVREAIRQYKLGSIITICWHAVPPTAQEPVTFQPARGADPQKLASVQGQLTDQQFRDILTKGTPLYKSWCDQVDSVAVYLKKTSGCPRACALASVSRNERRLVLVGRKNRKIQHKGTLQADIRQAGEVTISS